MYAGYIDSARNTDHAWIETSVFWKHLTAEQAGQLRPIAKDDAIEVDWRPVAEVLSGPPRPHTPILRRLLAARRH
jgi:ADP-ribose pyrophosphatase